MCRTPHSPPASPRGSTSPLLRGTALCLLGLMGSVLPQARPLTRACRADEAAATAAADRPPAPETPVDPVQDTLAQIQVAPVNPADIQRWIAELDSQQYALREQAQAHLVQAGAVAVSALQKGATGGSLEQTSRAVRALGQIAAIGDLRAFDQVQDALESLAQSKSRSVARRAQLELEGLGDVRTRHAIERFERLGGRMKKTRNTAATQAALANGLDFRPGTQAVLNRKWHGTDDDLVLLTRIANLETVYVTRSAPVSADALEKLKRSITKAQPNRRFQIQPRGDAMVGIQAGTGEDECLISGVEEGSPAERAGLKPGDVITHYNGEKIDGFERLVEITRDLTPGTKVSLEVIRREQPRTIELELADFE